MSELTLIALREENRSNNKIKVIRVVAMGVLAVILMCMVYTAGWVSGTVIGASSNDSKYSPPMSFPAWCLFRPDIPWMWQDHLLDIQYNGTYVVLAFLILVFSYSTRALLLYYESIGQVVTLAAKFLYFDKLAGLFGIKNMKSIESRLNGMGRRKWSYRILRSLYAIFVACRQTFDSTIWEVRNTQYLLTALY